MCIQLAPPAIAEREIAAVGVLRASHLALGPKPEEFESAIAGFATPHVSGKAGWILKNLQTAAQSSQAELSPVTLPPSPDQS